jgi:HEAT repeat protein
MPLIRKEPGKKARSVEPGSPLDGLSDPSPDMRWAAARAAANQPGVVPALAQALALEREPRVLEALFTALAHIASSESVIAVLPYVRSDTASLRTSALDALRAMPGPTEAHLRQLLSDPDSDVRLLACDLARVMPGSEASRLLCALIDAEPQANVCAAAVEVLSEIGDESAIPSLTRCAARFPDDPFLSFAIQTASERLSAHGGRG